MSKAGGERTRRVPGQKPQGCKRFLLSAMTRGCRHFSVTSVLGKPKLYFAAEDERPGKSCIFAISHRSEARLCFVSLNHWINDAAMNPYRQLSFPSHFLLLKRSVCLGHTVMGGTRLPMPSHCFVICIRLGSPLAHLTHFVSRCPHDELVGRSGDQIVVHLPMPTSYAPNQQKVY